jgi:hypothetical protein
MQPGNHPKHYRRLGITRRLGDIMVKYLLWPLFQKQPLVMGIAFVIVIGMIAVMVMFGL